MNSKQWAVLFVALVSFDYASATFFGGYKGVSKPYAGDNGGYYGWSSGCRCNERVVSNLDNCIKKVKTRVSGKFGSGCSVRDQSLEEYQFSNGKLKGLHKFERRGDYKCSLSKDYVRVVFNIGFFDLVINYYVSLVEEILSGLLGGIGSLIGNILGNVSNFLFRCAFPEVYCTVVLHQRFGVSQGFELEGLYLNDIENINFLNKGFSRHQQSFLPYFRPICDHALRYVFQKQLSSIFSQSFSSVTVDYSQFYYESSRKTTYEEDGDDGDCEECEE